MNRPSLLLPLLAGFLPALAAGPGGAPASPPPPPAVTWVNPVPAPAAETRAFPARLAARDQVEVRTRLSGHLESAEFTEGARVKRGQVLFRLDARPYEIEVRRAEAALARARTQRERLEAEAARAQRLVDANAISSEEREARARQAAEAVESEKVASAELEAARLNVAYTRIESPLDGVIGARRVSPGNYVSAGAGSPVLAEIVAVDTLDVWFDVDETAAARWRSTGGATGSVVQVTLDGVDGKARDATLDYLGPAVDAATGTFRFRATLPNPDGKLAPGMRARALLALETPRVLLTVPERAIGSDLGRPLLWVVDAEGRSQHRKITAGPLLGDRRAIREGLEATDRVIVNGLMAVRPNLPVNAKPEAPAP